MKSQRRHELKENVLAQELGKMGQFFNQYGGWIFVAVLLVALAVLLVWYFQSHSAREAAAEQATFEQLTHDPNIPDQKRIEGLNNLIQTAKDPVLAANAAVFGGDMLSANFLRAVQEGAREQALELYKQSRGYYETVVKRWPDRPLLAAKAHFGLGILNENYGDLDSARQEYEYVIKNLDSSYALHGEAQRRLKELPLWAKGVKFATTTQATTASAPATRPAIEPPGRLPHTTTTGTAHRPRP